MGSGYVLIAGVLLYLLLVREADAWGIRPKQAAATWIIGYYMLLFIVQGIGYLIQGVSLLSVVSLALIITVVAQYGVAIIVFKKVEESGDEYLSYAFWGGLGLALLFFVMPMAAQALAAAL